MHNGHGTRRSEGGPADSRRAGTGYNPDRDRSQRGVVSERGGGHQHHSRGANHRRGGGAAGDRGNYAGGGTRGGQRGHGGGGSHHGHRDFDCLNNETFGVAEPWRPSEAQVTEFEAFKRRQRHSSSNSGGNRSGNNGAPGRGGHGGMAPPSPQSTQQQPEQTHTSVLTNGGGGEVEPPGVTSMSPANQVRPQRGILPLPMSMRGTVGTTVTSTCGSGGLEQSPFPGIRHASLTITDSLIPPFTDAHRQSVKSGHRLHPWLVPTPMGLTEDPSASWMTPTELETILKYQLMQMHLASQALTRPRTLTLQQQQQQPSPVLAPPPAGQSEMTSTPSAGFVPPLPPPPVQAAPPSAPPGAGYITGSSNSPPIARSSESSPSSGATFGRSRYSSVSGPREALGPAAQYRRDSPTEARLGSPRTAFARCLCGMLRFCRTQVQCPAVPHECLTRCGEPSALRYMRTVIESGFSALCENDLGSAINILTPYEDPNLSSQVISSLAEDGASRSGYSTRLGAIAVTDKGLKFAADLLQRLTLPFPDNRIPVIRTCPPLVSPPLPRPVVPPLVVLFAFLEEFEQIALLCQSTVCDLFYQVYLPPLWYIIRSRADRPLSGPASAPGVLESEARRQLELNEFVDMHQVQEHEGHPHLVRLWSLILINLARGIEVLGHDRGALLSFLVAYIRAFLTGYLTYVRTYDLSTTTLAGQWLVPSDHAEGLLGSPPLYLLSLLVLLALQVCPTGPDPNITTDRVLAVMAMVVHDRTKSVKDHLLPVPDRAIIIAMIALITRVALRQSLRIRGILTPAITEPSLAPPVVTLEVRLTEKVEVLLAGANCLFGTIALAMRDAEVQSILQKVPPSCGCSAEKLLTALHQHFPTGAPVVPAPGQSAQAATAGS